MNLSWTDSVHIWAVFVKPFWAHLYVFLPRLQKSMISSPSPHFLVKDLVFLQHPDVKELCWVLTQQTTAEQAGWVCSFTKCLPFISRAGVGGTSLRGPVHRVWDGNNQRTAQRKHSWPPKRPQRSPTPGVQGSARRMPAWVLCPPRSQGSPSRHSTPNGFVTSRKDSGPSSLTGTWSEKSLTNRKGQKKHT